MGASGALALGSGLRVDPSLNRGAILRNVVADLPSFRDVVDVSYAGVGQATEGGWLAGTYGIDAPKQRRWSGWEEDDQPSTMEWIREMVAQYNQEHLPDWLKTEEVGQVILPGTSAGMYGGMAVAGGRFAPLDRVNDAIASAGAQTGVPPNLIKAMLLRESSGIWGEPVNYEIRPSMGGVLPYNGIFELTARSRGIDFNRMITDQPYAIWAMGKVIAGIANDSAEPWGGRGTVLQQWGWEGVAARYFSGDPRPTNTIPDELDSNTQNYLYGPNGVMTHVKYLESLSPAPTPTAGATGSMASPRNANWAPINRWDSYISMAAQMTGTPPNLIKAIMRLESGGQPNAVSVSGAQGLMQVMPDHFTPGQQMQDPLTNIMVGSKILAANEAQWRSWAAQNGVDPWIAASRAYLAGTPYSLAADKLGTTTDMYGAKITQYLAELGGTGGAAGPVGATPVAGTPMTASSIWGNNSQADLFFGFRESGGPPLYQYGVGHGTNGVEHTGWDIGLPMGSSLYSPGAGTVVCSATGVGPGAWGTGCSAFGDTIGGGVGRIEILLDSGVSIILGHSNGSVVRPGQRVTPGQLVGTSGGMNSPHIHLETRIHDGTTWQIIDPAQALSGAIYTGPGGAAIPGANATPNPYNYYTWLRLAMQGAMPGRGLYPTGYGAAGTSWVHNTLRNAMQGIFIPRPLSGV